MITIAEPIGMNDAKSYVFQSKQALDFFKQDGQKIWGDPAPVYDFLLEFGQEWNGTHWKDFRGSGYRMRKPNHCFENAFRAADRYGLLYCEGYATTGILPVHHAWCLDDQGRVVDFTWRADKAGRAPQDEWHYFGITFDIFRLAYFMAGKETWSCIYDLPYDDRDNLISFVEGAE